MSDLEPNDRGIKNPSRRALVNALSYSAAASIAAGVIKATGLDPRTMVPEPPLPPPESPVIPVSTDVPVDKLAPSPTPEPAEVPLEETEPFLTPDILHNVEVYGLEERLTDVEQIRKLYGHLDRKFIKAKGLPESVLENKMAERQNVLPKEDRYLEVVVRRSAYESFLKRQGETHVDFVEWIVMHKEAMNICFDNAKPKVDMKAVLRRIIVVEDELTASFWDEDRYRNQTKDNPYDNLDYHWGNVFIEAMPLDTDCSWAIAEDYRPDVTTNMTTPGNFWYSQSGGDKVNFYKLTSQGYIAKHYQFKDTSGLLTKPNHAILFDFGLTHEWLHYLCNGPDQYMFDIHNVENSGIENAIVVTGNSFTEPNLSPYLAWFLNANVHKKDRRSRDDPFQYRGHDLFDRPDKINLNAFGSGEHVSSLEVRKVHVPNGYLDEKTFGADPDYQVQDDEIQFISPLFETDDANKPHVWMVRVNTNDGAKDIYLPSAAFQISKFAGLDEANYTIQFIDNDPTKTTQLLEIVDESDFQKNIVEHTTAGHTPYAKMKIEGTTTWFIWYLSS